MSEAFVIHSHLLESSKLALDELMGCCNSKTTDLDGKLVPIEKLVDDCRVALDNELFYNEFVERLTDKTSDAYKAAKKALDDERKEGETNVRTTFGMQNLSLKHMLALIVFMTMGFMAIRASNASATVRPRVDLRSSATEEVDDVQILGRAPGNFVSLDGTNPVYKALDLSQYERRPAQNRLDLRLETLGGGAEVDDEEVLVAMYAVRWLRLHQKNGGSKPCPILDEMEAFVAQGKTIEQFFREEEDSEEETEEDSKEEETEEDSDSDSFDTAKDSVDLEEEEEESEEEEAESEESEQEEPEQEESEPEEAESEESEQEEEEQEESEESEQEESEPEEEESEPEKEANAGQRIVERLRAAAKTNAPRQQTEPNKSDALAALEKIRKRIMRKNKGPFLKKSPASKAQCACRTKQKKRCRNKAVSSATQFCRLHQNCKDPELQGGGKKEMYTLYSTLYETFHKRVQRIKVTKTYLPGIFGPLKHFFQSKDKIADFPGQFKSMQRLKQAAASQGLGNFKAYAKAQRNEFIKHETTLVELDKWFDAAVSLLTNKNVDTSRVLFRPLMLCVAWARFLAKTREEDSYENQGEALRKVINKALENESRFETPSDYFEDGEVYYKMAQKKKTKNKKRKRDKSGAGAAGPSSSRRKTKVIDLT